MRQYDRELSIKREVREEDALNTIRFARKHNISDEDTKNDLSKTYGYKTEVIDDLFARVDAEEKELVT